MKPSLLFLFGVSSLATVAALAPPRHRAPARPGPVRRAVTYAADVAPILFAKCAACHHEGEVAPFALMSYDDARDKATTIAAVARRRFMPPWQAVSHGEFTNERKLTASQIQTLTTWAAEGAPAGDLSKAPAPPKFASGWRLGPPDFVGEPSGPYRLAADGNDVFRCYVIHTDFSEDRYVSAVEIRPGNRKVVHHVLGFLDAKRQARALDGKDGQPGYDSFGGIGVNPSGSMGGWVPGLGAQAAPAGSGILLPKGADIVLQVHYHKDGKPETDQTRIGLYFAKKPVDKRMMIGALFNPFIDIPAGDKSYAIHAGVTLPHAITVRDVLPHMHKLGHDMLVTATLPDGKKETLVNVDRYDYNWQTSYAFRKPMELPKGTRIELFAHFDNSSDNPNNPNNPPKEVTFGEQTTDEMCFAFIGYTVDSEHLIAGKPFPEQGTFGFAGASGVSEQLFDFCDPKHQGYIDEAGLADAIRKFAGPAAGGAKGASPDSTAKFVIAMFDKNKDGKLDRAEFDAFFAKFGHIFN